MTVIHLSSTPLFLQEICVKIPPVSIDYFRPYYAAASRTLDSSCLMFACLQLLLC